MTNPLLPGLTVTLYPTAATWGALREFVRIANALQVPDEAELGCAFDAHDEFDGITLGPGDAGEDS